MGREGGSRHSWVTQVGCGSGCGRGCEIAVRWGWRSEWWGVGSKRVGKKMDLIFIIIY